MPALSITITTAGLAALVNAANTGTDAVTIAQVGISATAQAVSPATTAVTGELKRLSTIAGQVVSANVFHVAIADQSADTYQLRTFGLYLDTGVLFGIYSQAGAIAEKATAASLLLDADVTLTSPLATSINFGNVTFANPPASETIIGVLRLATNVEAIAGANSTRAIVPSALKSALDDRFGAGAPAAFVKTLLTAATAAAFRLLLAIKGAALKDEGAGNGLDADLLDGQHGAFYQAWANMTGKPATFTPSAHAHAAADTTSGVFDVARIPDLVMAKITGLAAALAGKSDTGHTHTAADTVSGIFNVLRIPDLVISKVTGLQGALDGKSAVGHTHAAADTTSGTFADARIPALAISKTTGLQAVLDAKANLYGPIFLKEASGSMEGGQINLQRPDVTGLTADVAIDCYNNNIRFFEQGGSYRGVNVDLSGTPTGISANLWHSSNFNPGAKADYNNWTEPSAATTVSGNKAFLTTGASMVDGAATAALEARGSGGGPAMLALHRPGVFAGYLGLDIDNLLKVGGYSFGAASYRIWHEGVDDRVGQLGLFRRAAAPAGWLRADGSAVSRTTYAQLFAAIGTGEGAGDGATTFNLPDWRGMFFRGLDEGRGVDAGRALGSYQDSQNLAHNHSLPSRSNPNTGGGYVEDADNSGTVQTASTGFDGGSEARPKNIALLACIKY